MPSLYMNPQGSHCPNLSLMERAFKISDRQVLQGTTPWDQVVKGIASLEAIIGFRKDIIASCAKNALQTEDESRRQLDNEPQTEDNSQTQLENTPHLDDESQAQSENAPTGDQLRGLIAQNSSVLKLLTPRLLAALNDRAIGSNDCETIFSIFKTKMGPSAMGKVNHTTSEQAKHAAQMLSLWDAQNVQKLLKGQKDGYRGYKKRVTTFKDHELTKDVYAWATPGPGRAENMAIPTKTKTTNKKKAAQQEASLQEFDPYKTAVRSNHTTKNGPR